MTDPERQAAWAKLTSEQQAYIQRSLVSGRSEGRKVLALACGIIFGLMAVGLVWLVISGSPDPGTALRRVGRQGLIDFYVAGQDVASDRWSLEARLRKLCDRKGGTFCQMMVWVDPASVPQSLPMSDAEAFAQIAQYNRNLNTGHDCFVLLKNGKIVEQSGGC